MSIGGIIVCVIGAVYVGVNIWAIVTWPKDRCYHGGEEDAEPMEWD